MIFLIFWLDFRILLKHWTSWSWWSTLFTFCWAWASWPCATTSSRRTWMQRSNNLAERLITSATSVGLKLVFEKVKQLVWKVEQFVQKTNHKCDQCQTKVGLWKSWTICPKGWTLCPKGQSQVQPLLVFEKVEQFGRKVNHKCDQCRTKVGLWKGWTLWQKGQ
jgi:hypothetical protein